MAIGRELDERGIADPAAIGAALGLPAAEAAKLLIRHQWREGDVALLTAAATPVGSAGPGRSREGGKARARMADDFAARVGPLARRMREEGLSLRAIAARLTAMGIRTARGGEWAAATVKGVLDRLG